MTSRRAAARCGITAGGTGAGGGRDWGPGRRVRRSGRRYGRRPRGARPGGRRRREGWRVLQSSAHSTVNTSVTGSGVSDTASGTETRPHRSAGLRAGRLPEGSV